MGKTNRGRLENGLDPQVGQLQATDAKLSVSPGSESLPIQDLQQAHVLQKPEREEMATVTAEQDLRGIATGSQALER